MFLRFLLSSPSLLWVLCLIPLPFLWSCTSTTQQTKAEKTPPPKISIFTKRYRIPLGEQLQISRGLRDAPIQIIEYFNPTSPQSRAIHNARQALLKQFGGAIRWELRLSPTLLKDRGYLYAHALLAALRFESFWPYLHRLMKRTTPPTKEDLYTIAEETGISRQAFEVYLHFAPYKAWIERDMRSAYAFSEAGEPMLFFNGALLAPPYTAERLQQAAQESLDEAKALLAQGTSSEHLYSQLTQKALPLPVHQNLPDAIALRRYLHLPFAVTEGTPYRGEGDAPIQIVEFSDFTCVPCRTAYLQMEKLLHKHSKIIRFYFKYYPVGIHREGMRAAEIASAAQEQRKFWSVYHLFFQKQERVLRGDLLALAREAGMDPDWLAGELDRNTFQRRVRINAVQGRMLQIRGVPSIFMNGRLLIRPSDLSYLEKTLQEERWKAGLP